MNKKVIDYIGDLLFESNCVIIPDLGGFVTSYKSASIHPIKHQFLPPSKQIVFNEKLRLNDGLLINRIAKDESITADEAAIVVNEFVEVVIEKFRNKEKVVFDKIGVLFKNHEGRLQFEEVVEENYLNDSFGLPEFFATPILRETESIGLRNKYKDRGTMSTTQKKQKKVEKKKSKGGAGIWVLSIIALMLCGSALYLFVIDKGGKAEQLSSLISFGGSKPTEAVEDTTILDEEIPEEASFDSVDNSFEDTEEEVSEDDFYSENTEETETEDDFSSDDNSFEEEETVEEITSNENTSENFLTELTGRYYVIAGAFGVEENAMKLRDELIAKGYNAKVLSPKGRKQLFRVSIEDYDNSEEGNAKVTSDNADFDNLLWLMKY